MNKNIVALVLIVVLIGAVYLGYRALNPAQPGRKILYYQSGMHPWIKSDEPGDCPICGMELQPVYEGEEGLAARKSASVVHLTTKQLEHINVKTEIVQKHELYRELRLVGTVAYDPALVVAEEEYLAALEAGDQRLADLAKRKLRLVGLSDEHIEGLAKSRKVDSNLLLPEDKMWVYADIYESEMGWVEAGQQVNVESVAYPGVDFVGSVKSVEPVLSAKTRSAKLRIEVENQGLKLKPQMYVDVYLKSAARWQLAVPKEAVLDTGERKLVYIEKMKGVFEPRQVVTGSESETCIADKICKYLPVIKGLSGGEKIVINANFLIDSQSQLTEGSSGLYGGAKEIKEEEK
jgi:multidrug efflux pump subunit AcrA (membrane-fusion protein)